MKMPLLKGKSKATKEKNFEEFRKGKTFKKTTKKFGKKKAVAQMQAVVLSKARESGRKKTSRKRVAGKRG
jgi:hypothetical protein